MSKQNCSLPCALNQEKSSSPQLACLSPHRHVPAPQRFQNHLTSQPPFGTPRSLLAAGPCPRSRCRGYCGKTNPGGPAAALFYLLQSGSGSPVADNRSLIPPSPN